jgi:hypothetical protein
MPFFLHKKNKEKREKKKKKKKNEAPLFSPAFAFESLSLTPFLSFPFFCIFFFLVCFVLKASPRISRPRHQQEKDR